MATDPHEALEGVLDSVAAATKALNAAAPKVRV